jgi:hypothetical protein
MARNRRQSMSSVQFFDGHAKAFSTSKSDAESSQFGYGRHNAFQNGEVKYKAT